MLGGQLALYCGRGSCLLKVHYTRRMLVKRDDKLIYSVQRSALLSGRAGGVQQQKGEAKGRRAKECERQRAGGGGGKSEGQLRGLGAHK